MSSSPDDAGPPLVGTLLRRTWTEIVSEVLAALHAAGFDDIRDVHRPVLREMLFSNLRPSELGHRLGLSKQAANDLVREFEANGYITLEPDPHDGRAKRIVPTERGRRAREVAHNASLEVTERWSMLVGDERYAVFEEVLRDIVTAQTSGRWAFPVSS